MNLLLAIGGGIAAYKAPDLVRRLRERDCEVHCAGTAAAFKLVTRDALIAVSGRPVADTLWATDGSMPHIGLVRWADAMLIAPATANLLARCALGLADDLVTTAFLALEPDKPAWFAPAMNTVMYEKPVVQGHIATLRERGYRFVEPVSGELACGESGTGAMADPVTIADIVSGRSPA